MGDIRYTVVIPCKGDRTVNRAIKSAIQQTHAPSLIIVIDDCSLKPIHINIESALLSVIRFPYNMGAGIARYVGFNESRTKYVAFLDSDDVWHPNKMEIQLGYMDALGAHMSWTDFCNIKNRTHKIVKSGPIKKLSDFYKKTFIIGCSTVVINKDKLPITRVAHLRARNDYQMWIECIKTMEATDIGPIHISQCLVDRYIYNNSISSNRVRVVFNQMRFYLIENTLCQTLWLLMYWFIRGVRSRV